MPMAVVQVGIVRMLVNERAMLVPMTVGFACGGVRRMLVLVMRVVGVPVVVLDRIVHVLVGVRLGEVKIDS